MVDTPPADTVKANLSAVGRRLLRQVDQLCVQKCHVIREQVLAYRDEALIAEEDLKGRGREARERLRPRSE